MTLVVDSSVVFAAVMNRGVDGQWAEAILSSGELAAPHHMPLEVTGVIRRALLAGDITEELAATAQAEMRAMTVEFHAYALLAGRIWQLRHTVTISDAWHVALAEALDAPLATLDLRLARAPGPRCQFLTP